MDIPQTFKEAEVTEFSDDRGKNLLRMLRAVSTRKKEIMINDAKLEELFQYFKDRKYLHIREVCAFLGISRYDVQKNGNYLFFRRESSMELGLKKIMQTAEKKEEKSLTKEAGLFLGKLGIQGYYNTDTEQPTEITSVYDAALENLCLSSDYEELYRYVKERKEFSYIEKACWALYVDNDEQANKWLQKMMRKFLKEDSMPPNSHFLDNNAEGYRDTGWLSVLIDKNDGFVNKRFIGQVCNEYRRRVGVGVSYLLCDMYDLAGVKVKKEISDYVLKKIRAFLEKGILSYDEEIEAQLVRKCESFAGEVQK